MPKSWLIPMVIAVGLALHADDVLDRIVATVDRQAITRSDVEQEARFTHLVEGSPGEITNQEEVAALGRLVDQDLIAQQIAVFGASPVTQKEMETRLEEMRRQIPGAESQGGWVRLLKQNGLTEEDVDSRIKQEIQMLRFVDLRFRSEVRAGPKSIQTYYETKFVPDMKKHGLTPPPLEQVQDQIEAILREERANALISDWLKGLRSQSRIQAFDPSLPLTGFDRKTPDLSDLHLLPLHVTGAAEAVKR